MTHLLTEMAEGTVQAMHLSSTTMPDQVVACCWMLANQSSDV